MQSIKANVDAGELVQEALGKFGKDGRGYESRPGRTARETLEEDIMVMLDQGKQASW